MAAPLDPGYMKTKVNAAKSQLELGNVESAIQYFRQCVDSGSGLCLDRRLMIEASNGLKEAQKVNEYMDQSAKLLEGKTNDAGVNALGIIMEALSISLYSEKLLQMKAEALCLMEKYEEVIQLCEGTLTPAEQKFISDNQSKNMKSHEIQRDPIGKYWRSCFISTSNFYLGKLDVAFDLLQKLERAGFIKEKCGVKIIESSFSIYSTIRKLIHNKNAGNEAYRAEKYAKAVEHYTNALSMNVESRSFAAVCLFNRAAAYQALKQITDAIADCSLALALDANYAKAISRRAKLHETIRDYQQAACDLQTFISILDNQSDTENEISNGKKQSKEAREQMCLMEKEAKKGIPLNMYLILDVKTSDTPSKIKKAYKHAALRHHPDKAGKFLAKGEGGKLWREIAHKVHDDADRLFKLIGQANTVLTDSNERSIYDLKEKEMKSESSGSGSSS